MQALSNNLQVNFSYNQFAKTFQNILDRHAPLKKKVIRGNQKPFKNRQLRRAIMRRSRLHNVFNQTRLQEDRKKYRQQRNYCVKLRNEARKQYFSNLDPTHAEKSGFWDALGPVFSNKTEKKNKRIILVEQNEIISDDRKVEEIFNRHFKEITKSLNIAQYIPDCDEYKQIEDPVLRAIHKYKQHPSIVRIRDQLANSTKGFKFNHISRWIVKDKLRAAKNKKFDPHIPMNLLKCTDACVIPLTDLINNLVKDCSWPVQLGSANITLAHKNL